MARFVEAIRKTSKNIVLKEIKYSKMLTTLLCADKKCRYLNMMMFIWVLNNFWSFV